MKKLSCRLDGKVIKARIFICLWGCVCLLGCASPSTRFDEAAQALLLKKSVLSGRPFQHRIYLNEKANNGSGKELHVYIDGDGTPWERNRWISDDPTSRNPMILNLLHADPEAALLLGRPCYHGQSHSSHCNPKFWTSHRYSPVVVDSMVSALTQWLNAHPPERLVLVGFSGGGALAVMMAMKLVNIDTVATIAANLDVDYWSRHHGYPPLIHSLNPSELPSLPPAIKQIHFAGLKDDNVPHQSIERFVDNQSNATFVPIADFTHHCCWERSWPFLLDFFIKENN